MSDKIYFQQTQDTFQNKLKSYGNFNEQFNASLTNKQFPQDKIQLKQKFRSNSNHEDSLMFKRSNLSKQKLNNLSDYHHNKPDTFRKQCLNFSQLYKKYENKKSYFNDQLDLTVENLENMNNRMEKHRQSERQMLKQSYIDLQKLTTGMLNSQKQFERDTKIEDQAHKYSKDFTQTKCNLWLKKSGERIESDFNLIKYLQSQSSLLKLNIENEGYQTEKDWCQDLEQINKSIFNLSNTINEYQVLHYELYSEMNWKVKQIQFNCQQQLAKQTEKRAQNQIKIHQVLQRLIQRVGSI